MKVLHLSCAVPVPTEETEKKIKNSIKRGGVYRDSHGRSEEDYDTLGISLPSDFFDGKEYGLEIDSEGYIELSQEDVNYKVLGVTIPIDNISSWVENSAFGCRIYTIDGLFYDIFETCEEIDEMWYFLHLSWFQKQKLYFKVFIEKYLHKSKKSITFVEEN